MRKANILLGVMICACMAFSFVPAHAAGDSSEGTAAAADTAAGNSDSETSAPGAVTVTVVPESDAGTTGTDTSDQDTISDDITSDEATDGIVTYGNGGSDAVTDDTSYDELYTEIDTDDDDDYDWYDDDYDDYDDDEEEPVRVVAYAAKTTYDQSYKTGEGRYDGVLIALSAAMVGCVAAGVVYVRRLRRYEKQELCSIRRHRKS